MKTRKNKITGLKVREFHYKPGNSLTVLFNYVSEESFYDEDTQQRQTSYAPWGEITLDTLQGYTVNPELIEKIEELMLEVEKEFESYIFLDEE